jgi:hypothetical protein
MRSIPKPSLICAPTIRWASGPGQAVQAANKCGSTVVLAAVYGEWAQQLVESKRINYDVALRPTFIGRPSVKPAVALKRGWRPAETNINYRRWPSLPRT